jgi:hypothetical protein
MMNKQTYDPRKARFDLAESNIFKMNEILQAIKDAWEEEMNFAPNDMLDTADFDNLKIKAEELLKAIITLGTDNMQ